VRVCPVWFSPLGASVAASRPAIQALAQPRRTHRHAGGLQFIHQLLAAPSLGVATPATARATAPIRHRRFSAFWAVRVPPVASAFSPAPRNPVCGNLCVINACAHNVDLLLSLAGDASARLGVPGHACPFIADNLLLRLRSYLRRFIRPLFGSPSTFFCRTPYGAAASDFSPAWGG